MIEENVSYRKKLLNVNLDEPFHMMMEICRQRDTKAYRLLMNCISNNYNDKPRPKDICLSKGNNCTKFVLYREIMNEGLSAHPIYTKRLFIPDYQRIAFTRLRLTSHNLMSEKGRWSRTPLDQRVCPCDGISIQNEHHALLICPKTYNIRQQFKDKLPIHHEANIKDLMKHDHFHQLSEFIYQCMEEF